MAKRVLVTALNWGLGHAARSVPVVQHLLDRGVDVLLASDGRAKKFWEDAFPELPVFSLPGYNIRYPSGNMTFHLALQLPGIARAIRKEQVEIRKLVKAHRIQAIISDHRYGCFHTDIPSAFICHQMYIKAPAMPAEWMINQVHRRLLKRFDHIWVPDTESFPGLAGDLSHQYRTDRSEFIGPLSRFRVWEGPVTRNFLVILSGPEPQRTILENKILDQAENLPGEWLIIGGKPEAGNRSDRADNISYRAFIGGEELRRLIGESKIVICRSGYSSIMDLVAMGKPALLIPTPGQPEQEYLAHLHNGNGQFISSTQKNLNLRDSVSRLTEIAFANPVPPYPDLLPTAVGKLLK